MLKVCLSFAFIYAMEFNPDCNSVIIRSIISFTLWLTWFAQYPFLFHSALFSILFYLCSWLLLSVKSVTISNLYFLLWTQDSYIQWSFSFSIWMSEEYSRKLKLISWPSLFSLILFQCSPNWWMTSRCTILVILQIQKPRSCALKPSPVLLISDISISYIALRSVLLFPLQLLLFELWNTISLLHFSANISHFLLTLLAHPQSMCNTAAGMIFANTNFKMSPLTSTVLKMLMSFTSRISR